MYSFSSSNNALSSSSTNLTSLLSGWTASSLKISADCSKLYASPKIYSLISGAYTPVNANANWLAFDDSLTYGLISGSILKYSTNAYQTVYSNLSAAYGPGTVILSYANRIIVYLLDTNRLSFDIYADNANALKLISSQNLSFTAAPSISVSSYLTKLLIYGANSASTQPYLFFIDYAKLSIQTLAYPLKTTFDPKNYLALVEENWLYTRQLQSTLQTVSGSNQ